MFECFQQVNEFFNDRKQLGMKPGLDRINKLLLLLNNPQKRFKAIHVAGTNGKGSTIHYLRNALICNGYDVGVFTSPSLEGLTGHILKNDTVLSDSAFMGLLNDLFPYIKQLDNENNHPTEFEIITIIAFMFFAENVDIALIEAGMGGREDTTNCFQPLLSIITNVEQDHIAFLGKTKKSIAYHKAGIIKEGIPVVIGKMDADASAVIKNEVTIKHAALYQLTEAFDYTLMERTPADQTFEWYSTIHSSLSVSLKAYGKHQVNNASLAIMSLVLLTHNGFHFDWKKSLDGIYETRIPGRFEIIRHNPLIVLDGAHNPAGIQSFIETVKANYSMPNKHLIFAAFKDKDLGGMLQDAASHFSAVTLTSFDHPRVSAAEDLLEQIDHENVMVVRNWKDVMKKIVDQPDEDYHFVTGSLNFIAIVRMYFEKGGEL